MVTATLETKRLPHATQSGPAAASLWVASQVLSTAITVALLLLLPVAGRHFIREDSGGFAVAPDDVLLLGLPIFVAAVVVSVILERRIGAALAMRTPGMLIDYASREPSRHPTRVPGWIAELFKTVLGLAAAFYAAAHAAGDHGLTALMLPLLGIVTLASVLVRGTAMAIKRRPGWLGDLLERAVNDLCLAIGLFFIGHNVAPRGHLTSPEIVTFFLLALVVIWAVYLGLKWAIRAIRNADGGEGIADFAEDAAEGVLTRYYNAAPTENDRQRAHRIGRITLYAILITIAGLMIGVALFS